MDTPPNEQDLSEEEKWAKLAPDFTKMLNDMQRRQDRQFVVLVVYIFAIFCFTLMWGHASFQALQ